MIDVITIQRFCALTGYTDDAVRSKMAGGVWLEDVVWIKAPDGRILISIRGYEAWAAGRALESSERIRSRLISGGVASDVVSDFDSHRRKRMSNSRDVSKRS